MEMVKWNPFRELEEIQRRLNRMFSDTGPKMTDEPFFVADWAPAVDIQETDQTFGVKVDLPDVKKEDIKVEMHDGTLTIQGERKQEEEFKDGVLNITLPKVMAAVVKPVEVKVA
jgi:HSP20 family protein